MIAILTAGVQDGYYQGSRNVFEHPYTTYSSREFHVKGCDDDEERDYDEEDDIELEPDSYDAYDFIKRIRRKIHSMDEIEMIEVSGVESYGNDLDDYVQHYYYDMETGHGYGKVSGYKPSALGGASTGFLDAGYCGDFDMEYENTEDDKEDDEYNDEDW